MELQKAKFHIGFFGRNIIFRTPETTIETIENLGKCNTYVFFYSQKLFDQEQLMEMNNFIVK
jgi:hypothetical protein